MIDPPAAVHRLVYLGTPPEAVPPLEGLVEAGFEVAMAITRPDKRRGRRAAPTPSPVKAAAQHMGIPVSHRVEDVLDANADLGVVVAFGQIIGADVLDQLAMVNIHYSLLPRWRGAAPVERAILAGDEVTGVCLMEVATGLDTGGVYRRAEMAIPAGATAQFLRDELTAASVPLLVDALKQGLGTPEPQNGEPTHAAKITRDDLRLDWAQPAELLYRQIRVGGAWTTWRNKTLKVWSARPVPGSLAPGEIDGVCVGTGDEVLELIQVQMEGKARQQADEWLRGARPTPSDRLGQ